MELFGKKLWIDLSLNSDCSEKYVSSEKIKRVRGIILFDDNIILMKRERIKEGKKVLYYDFPGGGVEEGETLEQALHREILEELGIKVTLIKNLYLNEYDNQIHGYFLCRYLSGKFGTGEGPEFNDKNYLNRGTYTPLILPISKIGDINLVPELVKNRFISDLKNGLI